MPDIANPPNPLFCNPYKGIEKTGRYRRINTSVSVEDHAVLKQVRLETGTIDNTVNTLIKKLINELQRRGIADCTKSSEFEDFVVRCELVLPEERGRGPRSTDSGAVPTSQASHDNRGTTGGSGANTQHSGQSGNVHTSGKRRRNSSTSETQGV